MLDMPNMLNITLAGNKRSCTYVGDPSASDFQCGLKRSWKSAADQSPDAGERTSGSASAAKKPSPEEKGKLQTLLGYENFFLTAWALDISQNFTHKGNIDKLSM